MADPQVVWPFQSALPGSTWPAIPAPNGAAVMALLFQLEQSQWFSPERLQALQLRQLDALLKHAWHSAPWYRAHWQGIYDPTAPLDMVRFRTLPILKRADLRDNFEALKSASYPAQHGSFSQTQSSGSTGTPVRLISTQLAYLMWIAFTLRDHAWHERNLSGKLGVIRVLAKADESANWGPATAGLVNTGPSAVLPISTEVNEQLRWLEAQQPEYLLSYPSNLAALARAALKKSLRLPRLREVRTLGEVVTPDTRDLVRQAWDVPVTDMYSAVEAGYLALQCPKHPHYHVQSEGVIVEVLDEQGEPCAPGDTGRVVITPLHNFAMPLVRYEIGDFAEVGPPCDCGRGLQVLTRIMGRERNMVITVDGRRYWPSFSGLSYDFPGLRRLQFVQKSFDQIEARLVADAPLRAEHEALIRERLLAVLPPGLDVTFTYCADIPLGAGGKFEDFLCEIEGAA